SGVVHVDPVVSRFPTSVGVAEALVVVQEYCAVVLQGDTVRGLSAGTADHFRIRPAVIEARGCVLHELLVAVRPLPVDALDRKVRRRTLRSDWSQLNGGVGLAYLGATGLGVALGDDLVDAVRHALTGADVPVGIGAGRVCGELHVLELRGVVAGAGLKT